MAIPPVFLQCTTSPRIHPTPSPSALCPPPPATSVSKFFHPCPNLHSEMIAFTVHMLNMHRISHHPSSGPMPTSPSLLSSVRPCFCFHPHLFLSFSMFQISHTLHLLFLLKLLHFDLHLMFFLYVPHPPSSTPQLFCVPSLLPCGGVEESLPWTLSRELNIDPSQVQGHICSFSSEVQIHTDFCMYACVRCC